jgi:hypothetical protein
VAGEAQDVWTFPLSDGESVRDIVASRVGPVASFGRVLGDRTAMYKCPPFPLVLSFRAVTDTFRWESYRPEPSSHRHHHRPACQRPWQPLPDRCRSRVDSSSRCPARPRHRVRHPGFARRQLATLYLPPRWFFDHRIDRSTDRLGGDVRDGRLPRQDRQVSSPSIPSFPILVLTNVPLF